MRALRSSKSHRSTKQYLTSLSSQTFQFCMRAGDHYSDFKLVQSMKNAKLELAIAKATPFNYSARGGRTKAPHSYCQECIRTRGGHSHRFCVQSCDRGQDAVKRSRYFLGIGQAVFLGPISCTTGRSRGVAENLRMRS
jgi:hypothetical protein